MSVTDTGGDENAGTRIHVLEQHRPLDARAAFIAAYDRVRTLASVAKEPAVVLAVVDSRAHVEDALLLGTGRAAVIGRHERCGLRLSAPSVALRQIAVLVLVEEGRLVTRLWDLATHAPFRLEGGQAAHAVVADGFVYAAVGDSAIVAVPVELGRPLTADASAAWDALPRRAVVDEQHLDVQLEPQRRRTRTTGEGTNVSVVAAARAPESSLDVAWAELMMTGTDDEQRFAVGLEAVSRGILVGRYERCGVRETDSNVSRVHALIVRVGGGVWVIDCASTNGIHRGDERLEAGRLADEDALELSESVRVRWRRVVHAGA